MERHSELGKKERLRLAWRLGSDKPPMWLEIAAIWAENATA
jgi:hypothetical protein